MVSKKKNQLKCDLSLVITVCQHSAGLMMPIGDPQDEFFYPTHTLMIDSYNIILCVTYQKSFINFYSAPVQLLSK